jgi:hypothetical protein
MKKEKRFRQDNRINRMSSEDGSHEPPELDIDRLVILRTPRLDPASRDWIQAFAGMTDYNQ